MCLDLRIHFSFRFSKKLRHFHGPPKRTVHPRCHICWARWVKEAHCKTLLPTSKSHKNPKINAPSTSMCLGLVIGVRTILKVEPGNSLFCPRNLNISFNPQSFFPHTVLGAVISRLISGHMNRCPRPLSQSQFTTQPDPGSDLARLRLADTCARTHPRVEPDLGSALRHSSLFSSYEARHLRSPCCPHVHKLEPLWQGACTLIPAWKESVVLYPTQSFEMNDDTGTFWGEFARVPNKQGYPVFRMEIFSSFEL